MKAKTLLNNAKRGVKEGVKGVLKGVAIGGVLAATAPVSPVLALGAAAVTTVALYAKSDPHLRKGFQAGLKKWRQQSGQNLSLKAKLLRFYKAVSVGTRETLNSQQQSRNAIPQISQILKEMKQTKR